MGGRIQVQRKKVSERSLARKQQGYRAQEGSAVWERVLENKWLPMPAVSCQHHELEAAPHCTDEETEA